jgi:hypothetical protein
MAAATVAIRRPPDYRSGFRNNWSFNNRRTEENHMPKKQAAGTTINKSDAVRLYMEQNPAAGPNAVVAGLTAQGIEVSKSLVNALRAKAKAGKTATTKAAPKRTTAPQKAAATARSASAAARLSAADLLEAKKLVDQLGGIEHARDALTTLERLR